MAKFRGSCCTCPNVQFAARYKLKVRGIDVIIDVIIDCEVAIGENILIVHCQKREIIVRIEKCMIAATAVSIK